MIPAILDTAAHAATTITVLACALGLGWVLDAGSALPIAVQADARESEHDQRNTQDGIVMDDGDECRHEEQRRSEETEPHASNLIEDTKSDRCTPAPVNEVGGESS